MICPQCKKNEAEIRLEGAIGGRSGAASLCEDCAKKNTLGVSFILTTSNQPAFNDVLDLLSSWHSKSASSVSEPAPCSACRWTLEEFQNLGKMGCSECYLHFRSEAEIFLKKIHGEIIHVGKRAPNEVARTKILDLEKTIRRLKMDLEQAVKAEQYEIAATLRDKIKEMEKPAS